MLGYRPDILFQVDYKGKTFQRAVQSEWEVPIVSTLPFDIPGLSEDSFAIHGVVYQFVKSNAVINSSAPLQTVMRTRCLKNPSIFLDFHGDALKSKYLIIEGYWALDAEDQESARKKFEEAERISPDNPLILNNLACVYFKFCQYDRAEKLTRKAIQIDPNLVPAKHNLGNVLVKTGRYAEAVTVFESIKDNPVSLGRQHEALGFSIPVNG